MDTKIAEIIYDLLIGIKMFQYGVKYKSGDL